MKNSLCLIVTCVLILIKSYSQKIVDLDSKEISLEINSVDQLINIADSLNNSKSFGKAEVYYRRAFDLAKKRKRKDEMITAGFRLERYTRTSLKQYNKAQEILDFLLIYGIKHNDENCMVRSIIRYGKLDQKKLQFISALKYYNLAMYRAKKINNNKLYWDALTARGLLLINIGDLAQCRKDFKDALQYIDKEESSIYDQSIGYSNIGSSFGNSQPDSVIYYSRLATQFCKDDRTSRSCKIAYNNMAWGYYLKGKPKIALDMIETNIDLSSIVQNENDNLRPALMHTLGSIYFDLEEYTKAINYFEIAHKDYIGKGDIINIVLTKEDLSKAYEKIGKLKSSIEILREIRPLTNALDSLKIIKEIAKIESKSIVNVKEAEISNLEQQNVEIVKRIDKTRVFSYVLGSFLMLTLSVFLYRGHKSEVRFHQLNKELSLNRLKSLRSMMNPHFLFNSFSTLQNYILKKDSLKANDYMTEFSNLIRNILSSSDSIYISFQKELDILKSYIKIEQERFNESFEVSYYIDDKLIKDNPTIPSMVVQPYIENAIIHGFSHAEEKGILKVSFIKENDIIICKILDNGIGRAKAQEIKKQGNNTIHLSIATRNTDERLRLLDKIGYQPASVTINDLFYEHGESKGTEVVIVLPILNSKVEE